MEDLIKFRKVGKINKVKSQYPLRKVINSYQNIAGDLIDVLECGHEFKVPENGRYHTWGDDHYCAKSHRCLECVKDEPKDLGLCRSAGN